jgi:hypothetical protein
MPNVPTHLVLSHATDLHKDQTRNAEAASRGPPSCQYYKGHKKRKRGLLASVLVAIAINSQGVVASRHIRPIRLCWFSLLQHNSCHATSTRAASKEALQALVMASTSQASHNSTLLSSNVIKTSSLSFHLKLSSRNATLSLKSTSNPTNSFTPYFMTQKTDVGPGNDMHSTQSQ